LAEDRPAPPKQALPPGARLRLGKADDSRHGDAGSVAFSPDGTLLATVHAEASSQIIGGRPIVSYGGHITVWDARSGRMVRTLGEDKRWTCRVTFGPGGNFLATASRHETVAWWDWASGTRLFERGTYWQDSPSPQLPDFAMVLSPDGRTMAYLHIKRDKKTPVGVALCETVSGRSRGVFVGPDKSAWTTPMAFDPTSRLLVCAILTPPGHDLALYDLATGRFRRLDVGNFKLASSVAFSADGRTLAAAGMEYRPRCGQLNPVAVVGLFDVRTGQSLWRSEGDNLGGEEPVAFSPDGRLIATANLKSVAILKHSLVRLWDAATGELVAKLTWDSFGVGGIAFSPDGKTLAVNEHNKTVLLWDVYDIPEVKKWLKKRGPARPAPKKAGPARPAEALAAAGVEKLWADLAADDAERAYRAVWRLALHPGQSVPFLKGHLRPAADNGPDPKRLARLIDDLNSNNFKKRKKAAAELAKIGYAAAPAVRKALDAPASLEVRKQLEELLKKMKPTLVTEGAKLRTFRAVEALEHAGTPEAAAVLKELAKGAPAAMETIDAKLALQRLARSRPASP
jgi:WD40 repeat protein